MSLIGFLTFTSSVPHEYVFVNEPKTGQKLRDTVERNTLIWPPLKMNNRRFQLTDKVNEDFIDLAWIGLYDDLNSWNGL